MARFLFICLTWWAAWALGGLPAAAGQELTLDQAVSLALERSPSLAASRIGVESSKARVTQAVSAYLPQVSASASYDRHWTERDRTEGGSQSYNSYAAGLTLSQHIYDFGRTGGRIEESRQSLESSRQGVEADTLFLVQQVKAAFFETLKKQRLVEVNQEAVRVQEQHLEQARALFQNGLRPRIDVTKSEAELSQASLGLVQARYDVRKARAGLERLMGGPPVAGEYSLAETGPGPEALVEVQPLIDQALKKRPVLAQLQAEINAAEASLGSARASYWPSLEAQSSFGYSDTEFPLEASWQAGLVLRWDLFTGFGRAGQVSEAAAEAGRLKALFRSQELAVADEVTQAYLAFRQADEIIKTARVGLKQAQENLAMAEGRYRAGVSDSIEFSDAQILHTQARSALVQAVYDHLIAWAGLEYAVGAELPPAKAPGAEPSGSKSSSGSR